MILHPAFPEEPWKVRELHLDLGVLAQTESLFALANGHLGLRGNLDEGEPAGLPGTYLNSVYELRPLAYVEPGYGYPESGQTVINITNGKLIHLLVDDEPFDVRYGRLDRHERTLDMRAGTLDRLAEWTTPSGRRVRVSSRRLVSFTQRAIAAIHYEVEPISGPARVVLQSELVANEPIGAGPLTNDPRQGAPLDSVLRSELYTQRDLRVALVHRTAVSGLGVAAAMDHFVDAPGDVETTTESTPDTGRVSVTVRLEPGQRLTLVKLLAYGWSSQRSRQALVDQVFAALTAARHTGWEGLLAEQREYLDDFWSSADVELQGDDEVQQAVRFALFHILQAAARGEDRPVPAKGLTGPGYDGHAFWDTETFVLPLLTCTLPPAAASALRWRHATLPAARERAKQLGLSGGAFPWRTINGTESSGYWPAGTAAFHINADIADAVARYVGMTDDREFEAGTGLDLLVETARLWHDLGHFDAQNRFRIDGVTGPDEYSALMDNNVYTNLMAQRNLLTAATAVERHADRARALNVTGDEVQAWRTAAGAMLIPFSERLGVHEQAEGFTEHEDWDFDSTAPECYPLLLHYPYFQLYRKQVIKQPDLVLAMHLCGDAFTAEQKARNFAYYEARTVRDSSLSDSTESVIAAETGHLDLAYEYMVEAALLDLRDLEHNTRDGVHIAALAGAWIALVDGFGGLRFFGEDLCFSPRLPRQLARLSFKLRYRGRALEVVVTHEQATYALLEGAPVRLSHHGEPFEVRMHRPEMRPIPPAPVWPPPRQPAGREPYKRPPRD
jgi:alpha,alpha-trehalose phosphorylase